jgi:HlyD family secretion protein
MKHIFWITLLVPAFVLALTGCSPSPAATPIQAISLDASDTSASSQVKASAVVVPAQETRLSFVISGLVEDVTVEVGDQVQAGQALVKLDTTKLEYDIIAAQAALTAAEIDAQSQRQRRKQFNSNTFQFVYVSSPGEKILEADSIVEQRRFALKASEASLAQGTLMAPVDGTVIEVNISAGEYVQPAQAVIVIVDLENFQIETTDLSELNIAAVKIGQPAMVFVEALGVEFPGKVTAISPISNTVGGDVVFKVTIELDEQPRALLWGMSADVEINVE